MKKILFVTLIQLVISTNLTTTLLAQTEVESKIQSSSIGIIVGYNESIVRDARSYYYPHEYYKEYHPEKFRGYSVGVSYNTNLHDNGGFATLTLEALLQTLPMYDFDTYAIHDFPIGNDYEPSTVHNHSPNRMVTFNSLYNINLFNSGFSCSIGGSLGYIFNGEFRKSAVVDSFILEFISDKYLTPIEPVVYGEEIEFSPDSRNLQRLRFAMIFGLNYNFSFQKMNIEPFIRYNHSLNFHSHNNLEDLFLHGFQTGLSVRFPL
ncbi:MAG: hypothetical protein JNL36_10650 [Candidatus Kapabacteria bacterium]|nr:hypothetical protein [Candidatus Kapabacteria bacterium]